jgi:diguanylate cyclase (GGDEF)-like protein
MGVVSAVEQASVQQNRMGVLAGQIVDAICRHPTMSRQEQTRQLALLERALTLVKGSDERLAVVEEHIDSLTALTRTDFLSAIPNRRALEERLREVLRGAGRHGDTGVLALFDVDRFKDLNDRLGHAAGDELLRALAEVLMNNVRTTDFVARLGGDQFAVLLAHTGPREGLYRARRLQTQMRETVIDLDGERIAVEASIGCANYEAGTDLAGLFHRASIALYREKRSRGLRYTRLAS